MTTATKKKKEQLELIELDKIHIGVRKESRNEESGGHVVKHVCSCGNVEVAEFLTYRELASHIFTCPDCGNRNFLPRDKIYANKRHARPTFFDVKSSHRGFSAKKTNLSIIYKPEEDSIEVIQPNLIREYVFDWLDEKLQVYKNGELEYDYSSFKNNRENSYEQDKIFNRVRNHFVYGMGDIDEILHTLNLENSGFYKFMAQGKERRQYWGRIKKTNLFEVLEYMLDNKEGNEWAQILINAGYKLGKSIAERDSYYYGKDTIDTEAKKPHQILKLPKKVCNALKEAGHLSLNDLYSLKKIVDSENSSFMNQLYSLIDSLEDPSQFISVINNLDNLILLISNYGYKAPRLLEYLTNDLVLYQGIDTMREGVIYLRDYLNMCREMRIPYAKYPRSLKREHDVATINHRAFMEKQKNKSFIELIQANDYLLDNKRNSEYCVILPEDAQDLIREGGKLNHCVGSYVKSVANGERMIAFMRKKSNIENPLITIDVRGHRVNQARGASNRALTEKESKYVKKWAEERQLYYLEGGY